MSSIQEIKKMFEEIKLLLQSRGKYAEIGDELKQLRKENANLSARIKNLEKYICGDNVITNWRHHNNGE